MPNDNLPTSPTPVFRKQVTESRAKCAAFIEALKEFTDAPEILCGPSDGSDPLRVHGLESAEQLLVMLDNAIASWPPLVPSLHGGALVTPEERAAQEAERAAAMVAGMPKENVNAETPGLMCAAIRANQALFENVVANNESAANADPAKKVTGRPRSLSGFLRQLADLPSTAPAPTETPS